MARRISAENIEPNEKVLLKHIVNDISKLVADNIALRASIVALTAKLDLDAGVTDTNYAALINPVASTATAALMEVVA